MIRMLVLSTLLYVLCPFDAAMAHDCWLQPQSFHLLEGALLTVQLLLGHALAAEKELPLDKSMTERFDLITSDGSRDLLADLDDGCTPVLSVVPDFTGPAIVAMERRFNTVSLPDSTFSKYLEEERLHDAIMLRELYGRREVERERFARYLKSIVYVGGGSDSGLCGTLIAQKLEIVLAQSLSEAKATGRIQARVVFDGFPLENGHVTAYRSDPVGRIATWSSPLDSHGTASFPVDGPGTWLVKLVHLLPCTGHPEVDWESHWAALSFSIP